METIKKGSRVFVKDSDGRGTTVARVVEVRGDWVLVKWLEARWLLSQNIMLARKGTTDEVPLASIVS